ncbi:MAG TPA: hypothetical protein VME66_06335 [Candidatus Acidoferrales bacterium]|nr:hypothetical protein [Candidatus Acidoferrales bacterium]
MNRSASVRIDGVLAEEEREAASQRVSSFGAHLASLRPHPGVARTYGLLHFDDGCDLTALARILGARLDEPPLAILEIVPDHERRLPAIAHALWGPGRPAGVADATLTSTSLVVEVNIAKTPLTLILDLVDVELQTAPGRQIVPLIPLTDAALTALARDLVRDPALDLSRLIEMYTEPLLQSRPS